LIKAFLKDKDLIAEMSSSSLDRVSLHLWWLGQSGFLIQYNGNTLLIDPYLSDSLTEKYSQTDKAHIRMTELVIDPATLDIVDVVSSSHNHTDHLDPVTLKALVKVNPQMQMVAPRANKNLVLERSQIDESALHLLNAGESCDIHSGISFCGIPAAHNEFDIDLQGNHRFMGYVIKLGPYTIYHSGDTLYKPEIVEALSGFDIDIAILPINGHVPERRVAGNLDAEEAISISQQIKAKLTIPCHYHMFEFNTVEPDEFIEIAMERHQAIKVLRCGEKFTYSKSME